MRVPSARTHTDAVACVASAVKAYTALRYHGKISSGNTVLIMSAASANGLVAIQLASAWGAKVMWVSWLILVKEKNLHTYFWSASYGLVVVLTSEQIIGTMGSLLS